MAEGSFDLKDLEKRMRGALTVLKQEFGGLRTGRASASLLDPIMVNAYGSKMPLNQIATVSVPEARMITVSVWDKSQVAATEKAIRESDLGLNPVVDGTTLRLPKFGPSVTQLSSNPTARAPVFAASPATLAARSAGLSAASTISVPDG